MENDNDITAAQADQIRYTYTQWHQVIKTASHLLPERGKNCN